MLMIFKLKYLLQLTFVVVVQLLSFFLTSCVCLGSFGALDYNTVAISFMDI